MPGAKKKSKKKPKLSAAELAQRRLQRSHRRLIRSAFTAGGFKRVAELADKQFTFQGSKCDFDDVFIFENVVVLAEYTVHKESEISSHLKKKKVIFDKILNSREEFVEFLSSSYSPFHLATNKIFEWSHYRVVVVYCSYNALKQETKDEVPGIVYMDYNVVRYLERVSQTIKRSARCEILEFLGLPYAEVGMALVQPQSGSTNTYEGSVLPDEHSNFGKGFKVVSFYADPEALLQRAYVLRRDGWRGGTNLYQRMISPGKIESIRSYLVEKGRVFINNLIVTLPPETKLLDESGHTKDVSSITKTSPARVQLPNEYNSIGIVDGQHRLFAYHEGGAKDEAIEKLRKRQNLLITGIVFPPGMSDPEKARFQATLFLEVNSTQTNAKTDLKQEIGVMLRPFDSDSIARRVLNHLNDDPGPLSGHFEKYFFDKDKIKTTTIVRFALRYLVRLGGQDSLYAVWDRDDKEELLKGKNDALLAEYIEFCKAEVNQFMSAVLHHVGKERWTASRKVPNRLLTTTILNGLIACMRRLAKADLIAGYASYDKALKGLDQFSFTPFKSSQYNSLGDALFESFFEAS
ncbi:DGQHR domain-containing protein [Phenylobacterium sp.]|uniref:DGQHR domain-containing protein n=1 Tax=Phenylobacterium sp. TaxID=1871053 RepID=UPI0025DCB9B3|nr:DGQHR domain-containing protein [Phenylobacterium sp.]MBX3483294.1 DGQHR domain-containing protein [Phenylobacterium sp.]